MRGHEDEIERQGAHIVAIGTGDLRYAQDFRDSQRLEFPVLVDEALESYRAVGTRKGRLTDSFKPAVIAAGLRATRVGARQGRTGKAPMVLGATHIIRPDGSVPFAWINEDFGDNPPTDTVLDALP